MQSQQTQSTPAHDVTCMRCQIPMHRVRIEEWLSGHLLLKQFQKIADGTGLRVYHCKQCGKVDFYR